MYPCHLLSWLRCIMRFNVMCTCHLYIISWSVLQLNTYVPTGDALLFSCKIPHMTYIYGKRPVKETYERDLWQVCMKKIYGKDTWKRPCFHRSLWMGCLLKWASTGLVACISLLMHSRIVCTDLYTKRDLNSCWSEPLLNRMLASHSSCLYSRNVRRDLYTKRDL